MARFTTQAMLKLSRNGRQLAVLEPNGDTFDVSVFRLDNVNAEEGSVSLHYAPDPAKFPDHPIEIKQANHFAVHTLRLDWVDVALAEVYFNYQPNLEQSGEHLILFASNFGIINIDNTDPIDIRILSMPMLKDGHVHTEILMRREVVDLKASILFYQAVESVEH